MHETHDLQTPGLRVVIITLFYIIIMLEIRPVPLAKVFLKFGKLCEYVKLTGRKCAGDPLARITP